MNAKVLNLLLGAGLICAAYLLNMSNAWSRPIGPYKIPNGTKFTHPCKSCHVSDVPDDNFPDFTQFKQDFGSTTPTIKTWQLDLAMKDSDGDGFTNGEELQDPNANWVYNANTPTPDPGDSSYISNPSDPSSYPKPVTFTFKNIAQGDVIRGSIVSVGVSISPSALATAVKQVEFTLTSVQSGLPVYNFIDPNPAFCLVQGCFPWNSATVPDGWYTFAAKSTEKCCIPMNGGPRTKSMSIQIFIENTGIFKNGFD